MDREKDLKFWQERGGQIEWRLAEAKELVKQMQRDLKECDEKIKKLSNPKQGPIDEYEGRCHGSAPKSWN